MAEQRQESSARMSTVIHAMCLKCIQTHNKVKHYFHQMGSLKPNPVVGQCSQCKINESQYETIICHWDW